MNTLLQIADRERAIAAGRDVLGNSPHLRNCTAGNVRAGIEIAPHKDPLRDTRAGAECQRGIHRETESLYYLSAAADLTLAGGAAEAGDCRR